MNRSISTPAIVLSLKPSGENNSIVTLLTEASGITYATLYGGPKSKMKSLVAQWNSGIIYLYDNQEKNQIKINDFDVKNYHSSFAQNLYKSFAASLVAEIAIKSRCAGSNAECFKLVSGFFDGMELCTEEQSKVGLVRFLWRYISLLGIQPDSSICCKCGTAFLERKFAPESESYYNNIENDFVCNQCYGEWYKQPSTQVHFFPISVEAIRYLSGVTYLTPGESRKLSININGYSQIKQIVFHLIEKNIESKLYTLDAGMGIL